MPLPSRQVSDQRRQPLRPASLPAQHLQHDLAAIGCATDDPDDVGALTGAWSGDDGGVYYIRQVGECVWWFGTDLAASSRADRPQGFANVAAGRVDGTDIELEWADVPLGNILGGGGLTVRIDEGATLCRSPSNAVTGGRA